MFEVVTATIPWDANKIVCFQPTYKEKYEKSKDKNMFKPTDTEQYKALKEHAKSSSDVSMQNILSVVKASMKLLILKQFLSSFDFSKELYCI